MFSLRSFIGFSLSVLIHGSMGAYILTQNFKAEKPKPKKIAMQMAMFKISPPPVVAAKPAETTPLEPVIKLAESKPVVVTPPEKSVVKEVAKLKPKPVLVEPPKPEPKPVKVISKPVPIEETVAVIKPIPKPPIKVKKKKIIKKKVFKKKKKVLRPKKLIAKKKPKVKPKRKVQPKKRVVAQRKATPKPHHARKPKPPLHKPTQRKATPKRLVRHVPKKTKANTQQRVRPKRTNKPAAKRVVATKAIPAPRRPPAQSRVASNPHLERQYEKSIQQRINQKKSYPRRAKRMRKQGVVKVAFTISRNGIVSRLRIVKSSGVKSLDKAALSAVKKVGRFPAIPAGIRKSTWDFDIPIAYHLR